MAGGWGRCVSGLRSWSSVLGSPCCLEQKISRVLLHSEAYAYIAAICAAALTISTPFSVKLRNGELVRQDRVAWRRGCSLRAAVRPLLSSAGVLGPLQQPQQFKRPGQTACQALGGIPDYPRLSPIIPDRQAGNFPGKIQRLDRSYLLRRSHQRSKNNTGHTQARTTPTALALVSATAVDF